MEKVQKRFQKYLDVRSFINVRANLTLLLKTLLTEEQRILFRRQKKRAISNIDISSTESQ